MTAALEFSDHSVHSAFGLRYRSRLASIPLPRVEDVSSEFDVDVTLGAVPSTLGGGAFKTTRFEAQPGRLLFKTRTIADYLVEDGCRIRVHPKDGQAESLRMYNLLFGAVTGGLLIQRGTLALHGCSIETPAGAVVVCGGSGAGKSTLAVLLLARGFRVLDDNIAALHLRRGEFMAQPGLGYLRLTGDTLQMAKMKARGPGFTAPFETKYLHLLGPHEFCGVERPLRNIFVLDRESQVLEQPLRGNDKLTVVRRNTFMGRMAPGLGQLSGHFRSWFELADSSPVHMLGRPREDSVESWADRIATVIMRASSRA